MVTEVDEAPDDHEGPRGKRCPRVRRQRGRCSEQWRRGTAAGEDIGKPVAANDANGDALTYALSGTDAASFDIGTGSRVS